MEQKVTFSCGDIELEGLFHPADEKNGVVITHPHPLYGGDMHNLVVETITRAYSQLGFSSLRFNFRGVGTSGGTFDDGHGEQSDILAAIDFLEAAGVRVTDLAGYSFGAWVLAQVSPHPDKPVRILMVAPPVAFMDFSGILPPLSTIGTIIGSLDDFAPPVDVEKWLNTCSMADGMTIIQGADHFFSGHLHQLQNAVSEAISP